ncbi:MAG: chorismate mutase [Luteibaculaceae bacterium]
MENTLNTSKWLKDLNLEHPLVIAGPCSAETEEQVLHIARALKKTDVSIFRAGIWKPRTRPGGFEGVGAIGLPWLNRVQEETGFKVATEVANAHHVELALKHNIDVLWIGARTAVNPFAVQEIAEVLKDTEAIVLLKNPVNPDLSLWVGGLERLINANIKNLGVIHRGFSTYDKSKYRNIPNWQVAVDFKNQFPNVPLIVDPSHIGGKRELIFDISQKALDLNYDGLMIETHHKPDEAWSDAAQQVTPDRLAEIIKELTIRKVSDSSSDYQYGIQQLRNEIDDFDTQLITLLAGRMAVASRIGELKKAHNVAVLQNARWTAMLQKVEEEGLKKGLGKSFLGNIFRVIHQESIAVQEEIVANKLINK